MSTNNKIPKNAVVSDESRKILNALQKLQNSEDSLSSLAKQGIISDVGTAIYEMSKKEFKLKEDFVLKVHKNKISEVSVKKNGTMTTVYQTRMPDKSRPRFITYEGLIEHLFQYYTSLSYNLDGTLPKEIDYSFGAVFERALEEKKLRENPKEPTLRDYKITYAAYITKQFAEKDIRKITALEIDAYILNRLQAVSTKEKRLLKFKGVLNLVFSYALAPERKYIDINPVRSSNKIFKRYCVQSSTRPEEKAFQPDQVQKIKDHLWERVNRRPYDVNGYAILFAASSGVRVGEIPSLKWSDIEDNAIHIHSQQNDTYDPDSIEVKNSPYVTQEGKNFSYYNPTTKNEKGVSSNGRYFPMTKELKEILDAVKEKQKELGIVSEWVFCKPSGEWITIQGYISALGRVCRKLNLPITNNHALRMAFNSYVLVEKGLEAPDRAKLLGHSVETNLRHYTYAKSDDYLDELRNILDSDCKKAENTSENTDFTGSDGVSTPQYPAILKFTKKKRTLQTANLKDSLVKNNRGA